MRLKRFEKNIVRPVVIQPELFQFFDQHNYLVD
jgi:hypothetical protein